MKKPLAFLTILAVFLTFCNATFAQSGMQDVVYLNNGNIYRGLIIEQVPNVSLKIRTIGGNVFSVAIGDVTKITKEDIVNENISLAPKKKVRVRDTTKYKFTPRPKGYFFQSQILLEAVQGGIRIINGYKFGRFGYLGIGVGFDNVIASASASFGGVEDFGPFSGSNGNYGGIYLPIYLFHQGDILNTRVTPFYTVEAGYAMAFRNGPFGMFNDGGGSYREGGFMGGVGFGVRFNSKRRRTHFSLLLNLNVKNVNYSVDDYFYDDQGLYYYEQATISDLLFFPGLRFGIGF